MTRPQQKYEDVDEVKDADGVVAVISRPTMYRKPIKKNDFAVAFFKEYRREDEDETRRTAFLKPKHVTGAVARLVPLVDKRIDELVDETNAEGN